MNKQQLLALTEFGHHAVEIEPPPPDIYTVNIPVMAPVDVEIIKVTAQFVAMNGQTFLNGLTQRERGNPQFAFLIPSHSYFSFFTNLVESYANCVKIPQHFIKLLTNYHTDYVIAVESALKRSKYEIKEEKEKKEQEEMAINERNEMYAIDWNDFVVVESVTFGEAVILLL